MMPDQDTTAAAERLLAESTPMSGSGHYGHVDVHGVAAAYLAIAKADVPREVAEIAARAERLEPDRLKLRERIVKLRDRSFDLLKNTLNETECCITLLVDDRAALLRIVRALMAERDAAKERERIAHDHRAIAEKEREAAEQRATEAEGALWRLFPNTHTVEIEGGKKADPFEGPGETYHDAYFRVVAERDAALQELAARKEENIRLFEERALAIRSCEKTKAALSTEREHRAEVQRLLDLHIVLFERAEIERDSALMENAELRGHIEGAWCVSFEDNYICAFCRNSTKDPNKKFPHAMECITVAIDLISRENKS